MVSGAEHRLFRGRRFLGQEKVEDIRLYSLNFMKPGSGGQARQGSKIPGQLLACRIRQFSSEMNMKVFRRKSSGAWNLAGLRIRPAAEKKIQLRPVGVLTSSFYFYSSGNRTFSLGVLMRATATGFRMENFIPPPVRTHTDRSRLL